MKFPKNGNTKQINEYWEELANDVLLNKKIVKVEYLSKENTNKYGWYKRPVIFWLDDGTHIQVQCDDEGNDGGVLYYIRPPKNNQSESEQGTLPVL